MQQVRHVIALAEVARVRATQRLLRLRSEEHDFEVPATGQIDRGRKSLDHVLDGAHRREMLVDPPLDHRSGAKVVGIAQLVHARVAVDTSALQPRCEMHPSAVDRAFRVSGHPRSVVCVPDADVRQSPSRASRRAFVP
jgi:hypothetical protein